MESESKTSLCQISTIADLHNKYDLGVAVGSVAEWIGRPGRRRRRGIRQPASEDGRPVRAKRPPTPSTPPLS